MRDSKSTKQQPVHARTDGGLLMVRHQYPLLAAAIALIGMGTTAMASNWGTPVYDEAGNYAGCKSKHTGRLFTPAEVTELGCNTDVN